MIQDLFSIPWMNDQYFFFLFPKQIQRLFFVSTFNVRALVTCKKKEDQNTYIH